ncbi:MAG: transposase zinc-binding domain-containing protein [Spirochaetes bacterium]|nr:transposase zinc-binding domain-containing protein [Spirochaetota bacterium]
MSCSDHTLGLTRIQCSNLGCKHGIFKIFSCKRFYFYQSCSRERSILFCERISDQVLLKLPYGYFSLFFKKCFGYLSGTINKFFGVIAVLISKMIVD